MRLQLEGLSIDTGRYEKAVVGRTSLKMVDDIMPFVCLHTTIGKTPLKVINGELELTD